LHIRGEILLLIFLRLGAALMLMPYIGSLCRKVWYAVLAASASWVLYPLAVERFGGWSPSSAGELAVLSFEQFLTGLMVGLWTRIAVAAFELSGQIVGFQMGFAVVNVFDPTTGLQASVVAHLESLLAALVFFGCNLHHTFLEGLIGNFGPEPYLFSSPNIALGLARAAGDMFEASLMLSAPVIASLFLSKIGLAILARAVPQINVFIFGFPITIGLGLIMLSLSLPQMAATMSAFLKESMRFVALIGR